MLFGTSVMENIRYGCPTASDEEVVRAARLANAHNFIEKFPDRYSTMVGERGVALSGGQKQRYLVLYTTKLNWARYFLTSPKD